MAAPSAECIDVGNKQTEIVITVLKPTVELGLRRDIWIVVAEIRRHRAFLTPFFSFLLHYVQTDHYYYYYY